LVTLAAIAAMAPRNWLAKPVTDGQWINGQFIAGHFESVPREDGEDGLRSVFVPE
jgi:hypothetical protein